MPVLLAFSMLATSCGRESSGPLALDRVATMLDEGATVRLIPQGARQGRLEWVSDNESVAVVDRRGVVSGLSYGAARVTVKNRRTGEEATCLISVGYKVQNPILPPSWDLYIADGEPHVFDGRMYIYGSRDNYDGIGEDGKLDWCSDNYHVIWSDDLLHWTDAGEALNIKDIPEDVMGGGTRLWAPDVFQDPASGMYHMLACANNGKMFILEADSPVGPFKNARSVTLNGKELGHIDPAALVDDDGKVYIALPKFMVAQLDPSDYSRIIPETVRDLTPAMPLDNEPFEGPSLRKRGGTYYYIYIQNTGTTAENGWVPTRMAYLTAKAPLGPYTYQGLIVTNHDYPNAGNIHGSFESFDGRWYVQYHRPVPGLRLTRVACLDPLDFNEDGTINEVKMSSSGVRGAFCPGDLIQASSAVEYSCGRDGGLVEPDRGDYPTISFSAGGQWVGYRYFDFSKVPSSIALTVNSSVPDARVEVRIGAPDGPVISSGNIPDTGGNWKTIILPVQTDPAGKDDFYLVAVQAPFKVKSLRFD